MLLGEDPLELAVADFNSDGHLDVASANGSAILLLQSTGPAVFAPATSVPLADAQGVAAGDLDLDGHNDLVVARSSNVVTLLWGTGTGTFAEGDSIPNTAAFGVYTFAVADFTDDGLLDIAAASNQAPNHAVFVLINQGARAFVGSATPQVADSQGSAIAAADFDVDGNLDLVVGSSHAGPYTGTDVLLGDGAGGFSAPMKTPTITCDEPACAIFGLATGKFDADGHPDLAAAVLRPAEVGVVSWLGEGNGVFSSPDTFPAGTDPVAIAAGDIDNDGLSDIVVANNGSDFVSLLRAQGAGLFAQQLELSTLPLGRSPRDVIIADMNRDGELDVVSANYLTDNVSLFLSNP